MTDIRNQTPGALLDQGRIVLDPQTAGQANAQVPPARDKIILGTLNPPEGRGLDATLVHELAHYNSSLLEYLQDDESDPALPDLVDDNWAKPENMITPDALAKLKKGLEGTRGWRDEWDYLRRRKKLTNPIPERGNRPYDAYDRPLPGGTRHQRRVSCSPKSMGCK